MFGRVLKCEDGPRVVHDAAEDARAGVWPARIVLGGCQAPFPPGVAHGPLLSASAAAIE